MGAGCGVGAGTNTLSKIFYINTKTYCQFCLMVQASIILWLLKKNIFQIDLHVYIGIHTSICKSSGLLHDWFSVSLTVSLHFIDLKSFILHTSFTAPGFLILKILLLTRLFSHWSHPVIALVTSGYRIDHTRLTMYYIKLLLYDTVNVIRRFSHSFSTKCIGYNTISVGAHRILLHKCNKTVRILTNTLRRETMTKS